MGPSLVAIVEVTRLMKSPHGPIHIENCANRYGFEFVAFCGQWRRPTWRRVMDPVAEKDFCSHCLINARVRRDALSAVLPTE